MTKDTKEAEAYYELWKKESGFNYAEGLDDLLSLMTDYASEKLKEAEAKWMREHEKAEKVDRVMEEAERENQKFLLDMMPSDQERVEVAMLVSNTMHEETLTNIVATVDMILDMMKRRAGLEVEGLEPLPKPPQ